MLRGPRRPSARCGGAAGSTGRRRRARCGSAELVGAGAAVRRPERRARTTTRSASRRPRSRCSRAASCAGSSSTSGAPRPPRRRRTSAPSCTPSPSPHSTTRARPRRRCSPSSTPCCRRSSSAAGGWPRKSAPRPAAWSPSWSAGSLTPAAQVVATELDFAVAVGRAVLNGRVDRLERDELGRAVVIDLKTGSRAVNKDDVPRTRAARGLPARGRGGRVRRPGAAGKRWRGSPPGRQGGADPGVREQRQEPLSSYPDPDWARQLVTMLPSAWPAPRSRRWTTTCATAARCAPAARCRTTAGR